MSETAKLISAAAGSHEADCSCARCEKRRARAQRDLERREQARQLRLDRARGPDQLEGRLGRADEATIADQARQRDQGRRDEDRRRERRELVADLGWFAQEFAAIRAAIHAYEQPAQRDARNLARRIAHDLERLERLLVS